MSPLASASFTVVSGKSLAEIHPQFERALRFERQMRGLMHHSPWKVRVITSVCCSRVSRMKFTA